MKVLVYQAYGRDDIKRQTLFSIVSLLSKTNFVAEAFQVWIYTEDEQFFTPYFANHPLVKCKLVAMEQIKKWRGAIDFVHRVKVEILIDAAAQFVGELYYCDGDTYFLSSPASLFDQVNNNISLMHIAENTLIDGRDPLSKKIKRFVKKNKFQVAGQNMQIPVETMMWNAGVLAVSQINKSLLPHVLELTDRLYSLYQKHIMEQLAFSVCLQNATKVLPSDGVVYHYWNQKDEYQILIDNYFTTNKNLMTAIEQYQNISFPPAPKPKQRFLEKIYSKFLNK